MSWGIVSTAFKHESDLVTVRRRAKRIAELLGFDAQDQTRLAAAVSEIARNAITYGGGGRAEFLVDGQPPDQFLVRIHDHGDGIADLAAVLEGRATTAVGGAGLGITGARRLVDAFHIESGAGGTKVELGKRLPATVPALTRRRVLDIAAQLAREHSDDPLTALREQSQELLLSLNEARERQEELGRLNRELEDTNRGVVALYAELDERAEQLRRANELKTRFLSNVSHELRTPLNSILALSRLLYDRVDGELTVEQERQVVFIRNSAENLIELVNDLLDLAKVEAGRIELKPQLFTVADLFAGLRGALRPLLTSDKVDLVFDDGGHAPVLYTDQAKVAQVLHNFISNALKFTERGEVRVRAGSEPGTGRVVFAVSDTGIGIAAADLPRIFEEFVQIAGPMQLKSKGTGLGLSLSRRLAELLGGEIRVDSTPGAGSTFSLLIPSEHAAEPGGKAPPPLDSRRRVLVVDDDASFRYVIRQILSAEPLIDIVEAADGADALAKIAASRPDLLILDLQMPVLDGFAVLERLTRQPPQDGPRVLVATSSDITTELRARLGVAEILPKDTLSKASMLAAVRRALAERGAHA